MLPSSKLLVAALSLASLIVANPKDHDRDNRELGKEHGNRTASFEETAECLKFDRLSKIVNLNNNATAMQIFASKVSPATFQRFKDKAGDATTELNTLKTNTTLVQDCNQRAANRKTQRECFEIKALQKLVDIGNNATALQNLESERGKGRHLGGIAGETQAEIAAKWKAIIANATTKLNMLKSNATLLAACTNGKGLGNATAESSRKFSGLHTKSILRSLGSGQIGLQSKSNNASSNVIGWVAFATVLLVFAVGLM
jgi:hypothetical protein